MKKVYLHYEQWEDYKNGLYKKKIELAKEKELIKKSTNLLKQTKITDKKTNNQKAIE